MNLLTGDDTLHKVALQAESMAAVDLQCERGYAHLGWLLWEVAEMQFWRVQHDTFRDYLKSVSAISKRTPAQLQLFFLTVRDLSDTFTRDQLESIGITKATKLRGAKDYAVVLPAVVVNAALDPQVTVKELKKIISTTLKMPEDDGNWMDLEFEFMVSPEERETLEAAVAAAMHTDPVTKSTISRSAQMKDVALKFAMEFLSAHSGDGQ
jgi:hypothetical protein